MDLNKTYKCHKCKSNLEDPYVKIKIDRWIDKWRRICADCFCCMQCHSQFTDIYYRSEEGEIFCSGCKRELQLDLKKSVVEWCLPSDELTLNN